MYGILIIKNVKNNLRIKNKIKQNFLNYGKIKYIKYDGNNEKYLIYYKTKNDAINAALYEDNGIVDGQRIDCEFYIKGCFNVKNLKRKRQK